MRVRPGRMETGQNSVVVESSAEGTKSTPAFLKKHNRNSRHGAHEDIH